jgi:hypothetical protein
MPRENDPNPNFDAYVIDTATSEKSEDQDVIDSINRYITEVATREPIDRRAPNVQTEIEYVNPLDGTSGEYTSNKGLTEPGTVRDIVRNARGGLRAWWIEDDEYMLVGGGYDTGVVRRRALSKALFHASRTGRDPLDRVRNVTGDVTLVTALGGGTGSGMFIDIAKELKDANAEKVNLFAILPGMDENSRRKANAAAALSELEYLSMRADSAGEQNPFDNVVLVPFGPARDIGDVDDFYDAVAYAIVARQCLSPHDLDSYFTVNETERQPMPYAPFTIARPRILRYPVGDVEDTESAVEQFVASRRPLLDGELALYDRLETFVTDELDDRASRELDEALRSNGEVDEPLDSDTARELRGRLEDLRAFLEQSQFDWLTYDAPLRWEGELEDRWEDAEERTEGVEGAERNQFFALEVPKIAIGLDRPPEEIYADEVDRKLERLIRDELRAVRRRANLLKASRLIEDEALRDGVRSALKGRGSLTTKEKPDRRAREVRARESELADRLASLDLFVDQQRVVERVPQHVGSWREAVREDVERIVAIDGNQDRILELLDDLETSLRRVADEVASANSKEGYDSNPLGFDSFDELNMLLERVGVEPIDEQRVVGSASAVADAKTAYIEASNVGILGRARGQHREKEREFGSALDEVENDLFRVTPSSADAIGDRSFECSYAGGSSYVDRIENLDEERAALVESVRGTFRRYLQNPQVDRETFETVIAEESDASDPEVPSLDAVAWPGGDVDGHVDALESELERDLGGTTANDLLRELCREPTDVEEPGLVREAFHEAALGPIERERERVRSERAAVEAERERYQGLIDVVEDELGDFDADRTGFERLDVDVSFSVESNSTYVRNMEPANATDSLRRYDNIADAGLWESEKPTINNQLKQFTQQAISSNDAMPIDQLELEIAGEGTAADETRYKGHFVAPVFMSPGLRTEQKPGGTDSVFNNVESEIRSRTSQIYLEDGDDGLVRASTGLADDWDVGLVTFVGGVFLDNLRLMTNASDGYGTAYDSQRENLGRSIRVRHTHGLDGLDRGLLDLAARYGGGAAESRTRASDGGAVDVEGEGEREEEATRADAGFVSRRDFVDVGARRPDNDRDRFIRRHMSADDIRELLWGDGYVAFETFESTVDLE